MAPISITFFPFILSLAWKIPMSLIKSNTPIKSYDTLIRIPQTERSPIILFDTFQLWINPSSRNMVQLVRRPHFLGLDIWNSVTFGNKASSDRQPQHCSEIRLWIDGSGYRSFSLWLQCLEATNKYMLYNWKLKVKMI